MNTTLKGEYNIFFENNFGIIVNNEIVIIDDNISYTFSNVSFMELIVCKEDFETLPFFSFLLPSTALLLFLKTLPKEHFFYSSLLFVVVLYIFGMYYSRSTNYLLKIIVSDLTFSYHTITKKKLAMQKNLLLPLTSSSQNSLKLFN